LCTDEGTAPYKIFLAEFGYFAKIACESFLFCEILMKSSFYYLTFIYRSTLKVKIWLFESNFIDFLIYNMLGKIFYADVLHLSAI